MISRFFGIMAAVLLAVGSLLSIREAGGPPSPMSVASADIQRSEHSTPRYSSKPIRDIQPIADRVLADNPETPGQAPSDFGEFDRESWRIVRLEVPKPDAEWMRVTLARPVAWVEAAGRDDHGRLWLEFKELGIANWANVLAIEPCPEAAMGEGRLVTGKFEHSSAEVIDLFVDGVSEPIGTTSNHPFWSEDRRDFVQAGQLRIGERLRLRDGSTPVVTATMPKSQSVPVFNLEVDGEHVYYVAASGVLVHNACEDENARTAFGLRDSVDDFADERGASAYRDIYDPSEEVNDAIIEARLRGMMEDSPNIDFDLTGMDNNGEFDSFEDILGAGEGLPGEGNWTNWEANEIYNDFNGKTTWWHDGKDITDELFEFRFPH